MYFVLLPASEITSQLIWTDSAHRPLLTAVMQRRVFRGPGHAGTSSWLNNPAWAATMSHSYTLPFRYAFHIHF